MGNDSVSTLEHEPSKSAMAVAFLRAAAVLDEREEIQLQGESRPSSASPLPRSCDAVASAKDRRSGRGPMMV